VAASDDRRTLDCGLDLHSPLAFLDDPQLDERSGEQPFAGDADAGDAAFAHEVIHLTLFDSQIIGHFPGG
jgi:hypothetical protein